MTHHVLHTNQMLNDLKEAHQERITYLQNKITEQQKEILKLQEEIKLLTTPKYYDV